MSGGIDPITLAVLAGRMEQIADEMDATLFRAAFNPIIAEAHDASTGSTTRSPATRWCRANPACRSSSASCPSR
jgi:hypothetical protein